MAWRFYRPSCTKQAFLFRVVDIGNELYAMAASIVRVRHMKETSHPAVWPAYERGSVLSQHAPAHRPALPRPVEQR